MGTARDDGVEMDIAAKARPVYKGFLMEQKSHEPFH